jgi:hypothetical protein
MYFFFFCFKLQRYEFVRLLVHYYILQDSHHDQDRPFDFKRQMEIVGLKSTAGSLSLSLSLSAYYSFIGYLSLFCRSSCYILATN